MDKKQVYVIDLFCGIGGFSEGARQAGAKISLAIDNWEEFLSRPMNESEMNMIQLHLQTGRPRGSNIFLDTIERQIGRSVRPKKRGRKPKNESQAA